MEKTIKYNFFIPYKQTNGYFGNQLLYRLCKKYKKTTQWQQVYAKVWIIGRTYAAPVERNKKGVNIEQFSKDFINFNKRNKFDKLLFNIKCEEDAMKVYKKFLDFIFKETGQYNRSFASKYLHFHRPKWFKIYDSYTKKATNALSNIKSDLKGDVDKIYADFYAKENDINNYIKKEYGEKLNNRDLDTLLFKIGQNL